MKMCVESGQQGCRGPIAGCDFHHVLQQNVIHATMQIIMMENGKKKTCAGDDRRLMQHKVSRDKIVVDDVGVRQIFNNDYVQEETNIANYHRGRTLRLDHRTR